MHRLHILPPAPAWYFLPVFIPAALLLISLWGSFSSRFLGSNSSQGPVGLGPTWQRVCLYLGGGGLEMNQAPPGTFQRHQGSCRRSRISWVCATISAVSPTSRTSL